MRVSLEIIPLYIYLVIWPVLYSFIEIDGLSWFFENNYFVLDFRLIFYIVLFLASLRKIIVGVPLM
uniref:hypothetical protein n=1 Tax=uncultured Marinobacter sp. TaxID=187379 RepID=UPI002594C6D5